MSNRFAFYDDAPNYSSTTFPVPRPFQDEAHEKLRQGAREGHRCQMLMAATGGGKTFLGLRIIHEALKKGKRAIFVCDRRSLIEQTSAVADSYGLSAHGVMMANHNRFDPTMPFQIASAQTLARRQWPDADVIVIDEAHTQLKVWTDHIQRTAASVIGLSATPFSAGLGKLFSNLVNATSMHHLTESGVLVPMRVFSCSKVDMRGAETSGGEWTDRAAQDRGMAIVGDVVTEWSKFARDRKTIVFGATIAHCEEMARQFNDSGIMAACFTSDTDQAEREMLLAEFRKPDSALRVLISVEALAKGFDCIAEGSMVLTDSGHKAIEKLSIDDRIWDGHEFVSHDGPIFKGERDVITYAGLTATPSHLVKTAAGWKTFMDCAQGGIPIVETSEGGRPVQEHDRRFRGGSSESKNEQRHVRVPMRGLRGRVFGRAFDIANSAVARVREVLRSGLAGAQNEGRASKMLDSKPQGIFGLWRARNRIQIFIREGWRSMGMGPSWAYSSRSACATGPDRQQRPLRAGKFAVGVKARECMQHQAWRMDGDGSQVSDGSPRNSIRGQDAAQSDKHGLRFESNHRQVLPEVGQTKRRVWDVLNAGPRNSFTCEGLLVHNCADVSCVCDVRPLRKSLSTAIQMWGRGLRSSPNTGKKDCLMLDFCIATGQRVLTTRGLVPIQEILLSDRIWDGHEFVSHSGVISRGIKPIIEYAGLKATPCHPVKTAAGWRTLGDCAEKQAAIVSTGIGRATIRECEGYFTGPVLARKKRASVSACAMRVRWMRVQGIYFAGQLAQWIVKRVPRLQSAAPCPEVALCANTWHEAAVPESEREKISRLWRSGDRVPFRVADYCRTVDRGESRNPGKLGMDGTGSHRQQRTLRAGEYPVGEQAIEYCKSSREQVGSYDAQIHNRAPGNKVFRGYAAVVAFFRNVIRRYRRSVSPSVMQTEGEVWDILNCGPRNSFTCEGLLVHNSGNIVRFADDFADIFYNGLDKLDCGEKLDRAIRRDDDEKPEGKSCPQCGYKPCGKRCVSCGFERRQRSEVEHEAGEMREVVIGKTKYADDKRHLWEQVCTYARGHSMPEMQPGRAKSLYKHIVGEWPPFEWSFAATPSVPVTRAVLNKIRQKNIAYAAMQRRYAA